VAGLVTATVSLTTLLLVFCRGRGLSVGVGAEMYCAGK